VELYRKLIMSFLHSLFFQFKRETRLILFYFYF